MVLVVLMGDEKGGLAPFVLIDKHLSLGVAVGAGDPAASGNKRRPC